MPRYRAFILGVVLVALVGCGHATATIGRPVVAPHPSAAASPVPATTPAAPDDRGIAFGAPVRLPGTASFVAVPVTNTTGLVRTFTARATYERGGAVVAEASGSVNDLLPGQRRVVHLAAGGALPDDLAPRLSIVTMRADPSTPAAEVAARLAFGPAPVVSGRSPTVGVAVTNHDTIARGLTVQVAYYRDGALVGLGTNAVLSLAPGATATVAIFVQGSADGDPEVAMQTLVQ